MALIIHTPNPQALLSAIRKAIEDNKVQTWSYDKDGDFTHVTHDKQWENKAWMRPSFGQGMLMLGIVGNTKVTMTTAIYGVFHGRFSEMVLTHFDKMFSVIGLSAQLEHPDLVKAAP